MNLVNLGRTAFQYTQLCKLHTSTGVKNAFRACLGKPSRTKYIKQYKVTLMQADGSTVEARYDKPLHLVRLPLDLRTACEDERRQRLALRKPQVRRIKEETLDDNFDVSDYIKMLKN